MHRKVSSGAAGFTLLEIMIIVAIIGTVALIAIPSWVAARNKSQVTVCKRNQQILFEQMNIYCMERNKACTIQTFPDMATIRMALFPPTGAKYLKSEKVFSCPANPKEGNMDYMRLRDGNRITGIACTHNEQHNDE